MSCESQAGQMRKSVYDRKKKSHRPGLTCHGVRVHAELAVVHRALVQAGLQPLHHRGCCGQAKQTLSRVGEKGEKTSDRSESVKTRETTETP